jgi:homoserine kinase type II
MAVYTKINKQLLNAFLENYKLGKLLNFEGIQDGVENTNYKLTMSTGSYILTIFEKRIDESDLPFFIQLTKHLFEKNFLCPNPISNKNGIYINKIENKACVINTYLKGKKINFVTENHCQQLGQQLALMHDDTRDFKMSRKNTLSHLCWRDLFEGFRHNQNTKYKKMFEDINTEIDFLEKNWPKDLPSGIIHADAFQDNVFFNNNIFSGIIDFYFACNDYYAYELAICLNAWCFNSQNELDTNKSASLLHSYQKYRKLSEIEKNTFSILLRGAAIRFLLTRLNDIIYHQEEAYVQPKDPMEFFHILRFHQNNSFLSKTCF